MVINNLSTLDEISRYHAKFPQAHLIVDTNVLLLILVGIYDLEYLEICPLMTENGKNYKIEHFKLAKEIIKRFVNKITLTPHIVAEINMLSKTRIDKGRLKDYLKKIIEELRVYNEHHIGLQMILNNNSLIDFGFTDISLIEAAKQNEWIILTDEINLYRTFKNDVPIISFSSVVAREIYKIPIIP